MNKKLSDQEESKDLLKPKSIEEIKEKFKKLIAGFEPDFVLKEANKELEEQKSGEKITSDTNYYKAMTLFEFDKGILLANAMEDHLKTFAIDLSRNLQREFDCQTPSEKTLAEITTMNFIRTLEVQRRITNKFNNMETRYDIQYLAILSKELDRAERHYLTSLQTLQMIKSPNMNINIKTNTAVVGQNQAVQVKNA